MVILKIGDRLRFYCQGCESIHEVDNKWTFNNDYEKPTLSPSVLVTWGKYCTHLNTPENQKYYEENNLGGRCHTFVKEGVIEYLDDCTHQLRGKHPLQEIPEHFRG